MFIGVIFVIVVGVSGFIFIFGMIEGLFGGFVVFFFDELKNLLVMSVENGLLSFGEDLSKVDLVNLEVFCDLVDLVLIVFLIGSL